MSTTLIERAFELALDLHRLQRRKVSIVPNAAYMGHLMEVAGMVCGCFDRHDPTAEKVVAAALLHDAIEDHPQKSPRERILAECGEQVLDLVLECTEIGVEGPEKAPWQDRKQSYLNHIQEISTNALLISVCDKLQSVRELRRQVRRLGLAVYEPFMKGDEATWQCRDRVLWFQSALADAYQRRLWVIAKDLKGPIITAIQVYIDEFNDIVEDLDG